MITRTTTVISGAIAGIAMLGLTAIPALARDHAQATASTIARDYN